LTGDNKGGSDLLAILFTADTSRDRGRAREAVLAARGAATAPFAPIGSSRRGRALSRGVQVGGAGWRATGHASDTFPRLIHDPTATKSDANAPLAGSDGAKCLCQF